MALSIVPVENPRQLGAFIDLAWEVYRDDPHWVAPLKSDQAKLLTPGKHPFHEHAEVQPFLAQRDGRTVGRIVATVNHAHNDFHGDKVGFFGLYECLDDEEASAALFETAFRWLAQRDRDRVWGPMNLSTNEECGLLIDGTPGTPAVMMTHNPLHYAARFEAAGLRKAKDLLAYLVSKDAVPERLARMGDAIMKRHGVRVRPIDMKRFNAEVDLVLSLYNRCWEKNWGFVPMTEAEVRHMAKELRPAVDPALILFLETNDGVPLGFLLGLPDLNLALRHADGRLFPLGLLKILWHRRSIDTVRVLTLGVVPEARGKGLDGMLVARVIRDAMAKGYYTAECSWVLEDNMAMLVPLQKLGATLHRTYRIYEGEL